MNWKFSKLSLSLAFALGACEPSVPASEVSQKSRAMVSADSIPDSTSWMFKYGEDSLRYQFALSKLRQPITSYGNLLTRNQIVLFGDNHYRLSEERELAAHLRELKQHGMTLLALEMFKTNDQEAINSYLSGETDNSSLRHRLKNWRYGNQDSYLALVDSARVLGVPILALDMTYKQLNKYPTYRLADADRNEQWTDLIAKSIRLSTDRVVVFGGANHMDTNREISVTRKLQQKAFSAYAVGFCGGAPNDGDSYDSVIGENYSFSHCDHVERNARRLGLEKMSFSIPVVRRSKDYSNFDLWVHLPQNEKRLCQLRWENPEAEPYSEFLYQCSFTKKLLAQTDFTQ